MTQIVSNIKELKLMDSFNYTLNNNKIQLSSCRGCQSQPDKKQQDAIGCSFINRNNYLAIVADGVGSLQNSEQASLMMVKELINWHQTLDANNIISELKKQIYITNKNICLKNQEKSLTTFVLAFVYNNQTIIANIGDSTAYTYDKKLYLLSEIDTATSFKYYEDIRFDPWNHMLTAAIGDRYEDEIHVNIIENNGQRIILSSDGVTDLVNEDQFINFFKNKVDAETIVKTALMNPDVEYLDKKEDNISAIVLDLPKIKALKK